MAFKDNLIRIRELRGKKPPDVIAGADVSKGRRKMLFSMITLRRVCYYARV
jgi:hypothetical protein